MSTHYFTCPTCQCGNLLRDWLSTALIPTEEYTRTPMRQVWEAHLAAIPTSRLKQSGLTRYLREIRRPDGTWIYPVSMHSNIAYLIGYRLAP